MKPILLKEVVSELQHENFVSTVLTKECPVSLHGYYNKRPMFRGSTYEQSYHRYDPTARVRKSRDSNNFSMLYTEGLESWIAKKIPPRRKSVIFSDSAESASAYGRTNFIFFEGNPLIAYGTERDNYDNYRAGFDRVGLAKARIRMVEELDASVQYLLKYLLEFHSSEFESLSNDFLYDTATTPNDVFDFVTKVDGVLGNIDPEHYTQMVSFHEVGFLKLIQSQGFDTTLQTAYDPEINNITVSTLSEVFSRVYGNGREYWTQGAYYLIPVLKNK